MQGKKGSIRGREMCADCGINPQRLGRTPADGIPRWRLRCMRCDRKRFGEKRSPEAMARRLVKRGLGHRLHKGPVCEMCGFVPIDPCQLDVDHKDGNSRNNDPTNYQTLCANCHRLKTKQSRDGVYSPTHGHPLLK
jgi:5-methylcytosine-specific restriction endonuclease McrA